MMEPCESTGITSHVTVHADAIPIVLDLQPGWVVALLSQCSVECEETAEFERKRLRALSNSRACVT
jgi:hypothetical protein